MALVGGLLACLLDGFLVINGVLGPGRSHDSTRCNDIAYHFYLHDQTRPATLP
jgi:hypothetical protein